MGENPTLSRNCNSGAQAIMPLGNREGCFVQRGLSQDTTLVYKTHFLTMDGEVLTGLFVYCALLLHLSGRKISVILFKGEDT